MILIVSIDRNPLFHETVAMGLSNNIYVCVFIQYKNFSSSRSKSKATIHFLLYIFIIFYKIILRCEIPTVSYRAIKTQVFNCKSADIKENKKSSRLLNEYLQVGVLNLGKNLLQDKRSEDRIIFHLIK